MRFENVIVVIGKTRLEQLIERFNTKAQARFYIEHAGGNFSEYEAEHDAFRKALDQIVTDTSSLAKHKIIERKFLPNFLFSAQDVVVALGQDGLVANAAKYVKQQPLLGVNPDLQRNDGILLPFNKETYRENLVRVLEQNYQSTQVTMAHARTSDGQSLLAFNDLFIGPATHTSARYSIQFDGKKESQSSSGLIVSTGAGSTGWLSSVVNMSNGVNAALNRNATKVNWKMKWDEDRLAFVVREPFVSKHSSASVTAGYVSRGHSLILESNMPFNGVIFSDGMEADYIQFNSGCQVEINVAPLKANLVCLN